MNETRELLERVGKHFAFPEHAFEGFQRRRDRKHRNQRIRAGVVGIAIFVAVLIVMTGGPFDRSQTSLVPGGAGPSVTGSPEPTVAPEVGGIIGLPLEEATPSAPERGKLVLHLSGGAGDEWGDQWTDLWVYADGRLIWGDGPGAYQPANAPTEGATGFVEQHLTPAWVEFLRTQVISTGLFEHDLALLDLIGPGDPNFLEIRVRNGDRLVWLTWAVKENWRVSKDTPTATPEQASALLGIHSLLSHPTSWPARAWENQDPETFVPSRYQVWLRVFPDQGTAAPRPVAALPVGERELGLLPTTAADILRLGTKVGEATYELTTDDVRALAEALNAAGLEPWAPMPMGLAVLRYQLDDPYELGSSLIVFFGPVLPHGEAVFLGPG
jgi:hypothetical protein